VKPAVIVPSYNGSEMLAALLESLSLQALTHDVVVVDNGSDDDTAEVVASRFPHVRLVVLSENGSVGAAINRGVDATDARVLVLLNNDVQPLGEDRSVVMAAGILVQARRPDLIDTAGIMFDRAFLAFDYLHGAHISVLEKGVPDPLGPSGAAAAFDRAAFDAVGGFDENFFAYLEDVDLVARLVAGGGRCRLVPDARGTHVQSATFRAGSAHKNALMGWSRGYTLAKYRIHRDVRLFAGAALAEVAISLGQLVADRTTSGISARVSGFRAGMTVPPTRLPDLPQPAVVPLRSVLARRLARRWRRRLVAAHRH
jgi:GT2 family glycosyltransferase